jgi:hypothetical protein
VEPRTDIHQEAYKDYQHAGTCRTKGILISIVKDGCVCVRACMGGTPYG